MASPSRSSGLPPGSSFSPEDAELITVYLKRKISGSPLPAPTAHYIHDADVYAAEPAALVAGLLAAAAKNDGGREEWYFFTSVRAKSSRDTRRCRAVAGGAGTWHSEKGRRDVLDGDEVVGYRQFFTFEPRNGWLMLEFSVVDREDGGHRGEAIPALCKIYRTPYRSASGSKRKRNAAQGERSGEGCLARVRRCLNFGSPPAAPNQVAVVPSTSEQEAEDPKEPDKQEAEESQYSGFTGTSLIPTFPMTSYGTTLLHPGQDWATSEILQGTDASTLMGNTAGLSCYDGTTTSLPSYNNTGIWSFPPSTLSSSGNTLLYPRHDISSMGNATSVLGCYDAPSMYSWCSTMSTRAEWANNNSNTDPLSSLCI